MAISKEQISKKSKNKSLEAQQLIIANDASITAEKQPEQTAVTVVKQKSFQQLIIADDASITAEEKSFVELHKEIVFYGQCAAENTLVMAQKLKEMRDSKDYLCAGFDSFAAYVETAVGLKERQAYNYITIFEKLSEDFLHSNAKIGVTKLLLLASINDEEERASISEAQDLENTSVAELKAIIAEREKKIEQLTIDLDSRELPEPVIEIDEAELERRAAEIADEQLKNLREEFSATVTKLNKTESTLKNKEAALAEAKAELATQKDKPAKVEKVVDDEKVKELAATIEQLKSDVAAAAEAKAAAEAEKEKAAKALAIESNPLMSEFKYKTKTLQELVNGMFELIAQMTEENATKCRNALSKLIGGWAL